MNVKNDSVAVIRAYAMGMPVKYSTSAITMGRKIIKPLTLQPPPLFWQQAAGSSGSD